MTFFKFLNNAFNVIIYIIISVIAIYILYHVYKFFKRKYNVYASIKKYRNEIKIKYQKFSNDKKLEIYNRLIDLKQCYDNSEIASQKARETRGDVQIRYLIQSTVPTFRKESIEKDYGIDLTIIYIKYDIDYLRRFITNI